MDGFLGRLVLALLAGLLSGAAGSAPAGGYVWPLTPKPTVVNGFDAPPQPWAAGHRGVDLLGERGQTVRAAGAGTVTYSGRIDGVGIVSVTHPNGWRTTYQPVTDRVAEGTKVAAGDSIGHLAGEGSHCAPRSCLHWGLLVADEVYRDPLTLLGARRPVLLPLGEAV